MSEWLAARRAPGGAVVVGQRDSNHPEAYGQENRFNFRLRPKRPPRAHGDTGGAFDWLRFTRVVSFDRLLDLLLWFSTI